MDIFNYNRRVSSVTNVGGIPLGGNNPIRIQSMTDTSTRDIEASINQILDITSAGADYVRLTTQGVLEGFEEDKRKKNKASVKRLKHYLKGAWYWQKKKDYSV